MNLVNLVCASLIGIVSGEFSRSVYVLLVRMSRMSSVLYFQYLRICTLLMAKLFSPGSIPVPQRYGLVRT